jgi:hypothetical protein
MSRSASRRVGRAEALLLERGYHVDESAADELANAVLQLKGSDEPDRVRTARSMLARRAGGCAGYGDPHLSGRVVDQAGIHSVHARERLAVMLQAHERATGNQIVVLTAPTLGGESVEDYAVRVFEGGSSAVATRTTVC